MSPKKIWFCIITFSLFSLSILLSTILYYPTTIEAEKKDAIKQEKDKCITYDNAEKLIFITCKNLSFANISSELQHAGILIQQPSSMNNNDRIWLLYAGIQIERDASLDINSNDVTWLKIVPSKNTPNAITVDGSLKVDNVKITSWNPKTNDYVKFSKEAKYNEALYANEVKPYIKINLDATAPTIIQNSELAYLGYSCSGCGGVTFNGGENSILKNNDIHHIYKGFYSKDMGHMLIEGNRVYEK